MGYLGRGWCGANRSRKQDGDCQEVDRDSPSSILVVLLWDVELFCDRLEPLGFGTEESHHGPTCEENPSDSRHVTCACPTHQIEGGYAIRLSRKQSGREREAPGTVPYGGCEPVGRETGKPGGTRSGALES